jgi:UDP-glucose 4-epimerase
MAILITGIAGFIGCNLARVLLDEGHTVFGVDNLCRGELSNLDAFKSNPNFAFAQVNLDNLSEFRVVFKGFQEKQTIGEVWHLAANSDIPAGVNDANVDLRDTFMTTINTLLLMKEFNVKVIAFASSSAIYGDLGSQPLVEEVGPLMPISNYGAMKLASEAAISAAAESDLDSVFIFRFPNVIGVPATHGVMLDFIRKLKSNPLKLDVLGNGTQQKGYLHVDELIDAMRFIKKHSPEKRSIFNIGAGDEGVTVRFIAEETVKVVSPSAEISYGSGDRGWVGDVPRFVFSVDKLKSLGWSHKLGSVSAVKKALAEIAEQEVSKR